MPSVLPTVGRRASTNKYVSRAYRSQYLATERLRATLTRADATLRSAKGVLWVLYTLDSGDRTHGCGLRRISSPLLISPNVSTCYFEESNSPAKSLTCCSQLLIKILS